MKWFIILILFAGVHLRNRFKYDFSWDITVLAIGVTIGTAFVALFVPFILGKVGRFFIPKKKKENYI